MNAGIHAIREIEATGCVWSDHVKLIGMSLDCWLHYCTLPEEELAVWNERIIQHLYAKFGYAEVAP